LIFFSCGWNVGRIESIGGGGPSFTIAGQNLGRDFVHARYGQAADESVYEELLPVSPP
jgi:hypothetical protein